MHLGKSYKVSEFIVWTRRQIYVLLCVGLIPVLLYQSLGLKWLTIPLTVVGLLGTATSFIVGFKNVQTYNRTVEAQQIWISILTSSRFWGSTIQGFLADPEDSRDLVRRHIAWLTSLRYELRSPRPWETTEKSSHVEYRRLYLVPERESHEGEELKKYLSAGECLEIEGEERKATRILGLQSRALKRLLNADRITSAAYVELHKISKDFIDQQGRAERIKNFPYPRQYAIINTLFVWAFCILLPFGLLKEFDKLNDGIAGLMQGAMVWLVIPFSATISWMYAALEQVGESTENPFEGSANDVPITQISRIIEKELLQMLGDTDTRELPKAMNDIVL